MGDMKLKSTIWLRRKGFSKKWEDLDNPPPMYEVIKTQNTVNPRVTDILEEEEVAIFVSYGFTVNIS